MDAWLALIDKYGIPIAALVAVSLFSWWLVRLIIRELQQRNADVGGRADRALAVAENQVAATKELTDAFNRLTERQTNELGRLVERVDRLGERMDNFDRKRP